MIRRRDNFGIHIVSDLYGCDPEKLDNIKEIKKIIETAIEKANLTKIKSHFHQFEPYGVTGFADTSLLTCIAVELPIVHFPLIRGL